MYASLPAFPEHTLHMPVPCHACLCSATVACMCDNLLSPENKGSVVFSGF